MVWRNIARVVAGTAEVVGKAFSRAVKQELKDGRQAAEAHSSKHGGTAEQTKKATTSNVVHGLSLQEATQILNVKEPLQVEEVMKQYKHLFQMNDKSKGGSFYIQSKVVRAKERIEDEFKSKGITIDEKLLEHLEEEERRSSDRQESDKRSSESGKQTSSDSGSAGAKSEETFTSADEKRR